MGRWWRTSQGSGRVPAPDPDGARQLVVRRLAIEELARRGVGVRPAAGDAPGDDWLIGSDHMEYRLYNLQVACAQLSAGQWADYVRFHFDRMAAGRDEPGIETIPEPQLLSQVRTRLQVPGGAGPVSLDYARPAFDGLVAELNRDLPTTVVTLGDGALAGRDLDFLYRVGQVNTNAEPVDVQTAAPGVCALTGESFFIASKALDMPTLVTSVLGTAPLGVLFAVPHRSLLFLHALGEHTFGAVGWLAPVAAAQAEAPPGGTLSSNVYYWRDGTVQPITGFTPGSRDIDIRTDGLFGEALKRV